MCSGALAKQWVFSGFFYMKQADFLWKFVSHIAKFRNFYVLVFLSIQVHFSIFDEMPVPYHQATAANTVYMAADQIELYQICVIYINYQETFHTNEK